MEILELFITFINSILSFKVYDITILSYLVTITLFIIVFKIISTLGGSRWSILFLVYQLC